MATQPQPRVHGPEAQAAQVVSAVRALGIKYGHERSFKLCAGRLLSNRFLLGFRKQRIADDPDRRILAVCEQLGMPQALLARYRDSLPESNYVHFGFEDNANGSLFKAYLEFYDRVAAHMPHGSGPQAAQLMHLGFKWPVSGGARAVVTRYDWHPFLSLNALLARLSGLLPAPEQAGLLAVAEGLVRAAAQRVPAHDIFYLEAAEEDNPRRSFDINLYRAGLRMPELQSVIAAAGERYAVPGDTLAALCRSIEHETFGHVSGGIDREGSDFLTVYHGIRYLTPSPGAPSNRGFPKFY